MIILLSPAKIQNFKSQEEIKFHSQPEFLNEASYLVALMRNLKPFELGALMEINRQLSHLNFDRFVQWHLPFTLNNAKQAVLAFDGEVYRGLNAGTFTEEEMKYAQQHLRLLSGLYGILKPFDLIQAYRLEVSSKLMNHAGNDLYPFWKEKVTQSIQRDLRASGQPEIILNLSSSEYSKILDIKKANISMLNVEFLEYQHDRFKQIVVYTKKARGMMARYVIRHKIENEEDLKGFNENGYWYHHELSNKNKLVFVR
jgi:hypothetical protein